MHIHKYLRKIKRNIEDYGVFFASKKGLCFLIKPIYEKTVYTIYGINLEACAIPEVKRDDFTFKLVQAGDSKIIYQIEKIEEWLSGCVKSKIENNGLCLVALDKERVAGFNLVCFGEVFIPLLKLKRVLAGDEAWSEQISVHKNYRRRGIATSLRFKVFRELKERGIRKFYGGALKINESSLNLARSVGFCQLDDIEFVRILNLKKWTPNEVRHGFSG